MTINLFSIAVGAIWFFCAYLIGRVSYKRYAKYRDKVEREKVREYINKRIDGDRYGCYYD